MGYIGKAPATSSNNENRAAFIATAGQTVFVVGYTPGYLDVSVNGALQINGINYTATSGTSFTMSQGLFVGDEVFASARFAGAPINAYTKEWVDLALSTKGNVENAIVTLASAATVDLASTSSPNVDISGIVTITSFGVANVGIVKRGRFTDLCTLTHNATSLILPLAVNYTTAVGDSYEARSAGSGNWIVLRVGITGPRGLTGAAGGPTRGQISALMSVVN